jgi:hypothetical protein
MRTLGFFLVLLGFAAAGGGFLFDYGEGTNRPTSNAVFVRFRRAGIGMVAFGLVVLAIDLVVG